MIVSEFLLGLSQKCLEICIRIVRRIVSVRLEVCIRNGSRIISDRRIISELLVGLYQKCQQNCFRNFKRTVKEMLGGWYQKWSCRNYIRNSGIIVSEFFRGLSQKCFEICIRNGRRIVSEMFRDLYQEWQEDGLRKQKLQLGKVVREKVFLSPNFVGGMAKAKSL